MAYFDISEEDIGLLTNQIAIVTGASSGIGLATVQLFLSKGATVIGVDLQPPAEAEQLPTPANFTFAKADVTSWSSLRSVFKQVFITHGRIDILVANAGIGPRADYLKLSTDGDGNLIEPDQLTLQINLVAVTNQVALAVHFMQQQQPAGGAIVMTSSCTAYQRFKVDDYVAAKAGVIGFMRSMGLEMNTPECPVRLNTVAPSWTRSGLVRLPDEEFEKLGIKCQPAHAVAKSIAFLVTDRQRHGQCLYIHGGRYVEMEGPIQQAMLDAIGKTGLAEEEERRKIFARGNELANESLGNVKK